MLLVADCGTFQLTTKYEQTKYDCIWNDDDNIIVNTQNQRHCPLNKETAEPARTIDSDRNEHAYTWTHAHTIARDTQIHTNTHARIHTV